MNKTEEVARAICEYVNDGCDPDRDFINGPMWKMYEGFAEVAIKAMQEPSEAMMRAGVACAEAAPNAKRSMTTFATSTAP